MLESKLQEPTFKAHKNNNMIEVFLQGGHTIHCRERNTQMVTGLWQIMAVRKTFGSPLDACSALTICNRCQLCPFQL